MRIIKQLVFILIYGLVVACVGFTITTLFSLPAVVSAVLAVPAVLLADRVAKGFGIKLFRSTKADVVTNSVR